MYDTDPLNQIPRMGGQFFWDQVYADIHTVGASMLYIAMFDEVDEGTAIFKFTNDPPMPGGQTLFVTPDFDGFPLPSDEYLWLAGQATRGLRNEIPVNQTRPTRTGGGNTTRDWTNGKRQPRMGHGRQTGAAAFRPTSIRPLSEMPQSADRLSVLAQMPSPIKSLSEISRARATLSI